MAQDNTTKEKLTYDSNPFTLSFRALGAFFKFNVAWPIFLICWEVLGWMVQILGTMINLLAQNTTSGSATIEASSSISSNGSLETGVIVFLVLFIMSGTLLFGGLMLALYVYIAGMFNYVALKSLDGKRISFGEAFNAVTKRFWRLTGAYLLASLKIIGGLLLFIIPGVRAALRYSLLGFTILNDPEEAKGVLNSHRRAKVISKKRLMEIFGVCSVAGLIPFVGTSINYAGLAATYKQMTHYHDKKIAKPKVHWLNYWALMLLGLVLVIALMTAILVNLLSQV